MNDREKLKQKIAVIIVMNRFDNNVISEEIAEKIMKEIFPPEADQETLKEFLWSLIRKEEIERGCMKN